MCVSFIKCEGDHIVVHPVWCVQACDPNPRCTDYHVALKGSPSLAALVEVCEEVKKMQGVTHLSIAELEITPDKADVLIAGGILRVPKLYLHTAMNNFKVGDHIRGDGVNGVKDLTTLGEVDALFSGLFGGKNSLKKLEMYGCEKMEVVPDFTSYPEFRCTTLRYNSMVKVEHALLLAKLLVFPGNDIQKVHMPGIAPPEWYLDDGKPKWGLLGYQNYPTLDTWPLVEACMSHENCQVVNAIFQGGEVDKLSPDHPARNG